MKEKRLISLLMAALVAVSLTGCGKAGTEETVSGEPVKLLDTSDMFSSRDIESGYDESECTVITLNGDTASVKGEGASANGSTVTVSEEGDYLVSGRLENGSILVEAGKKDKVRLILDGVAISSASSAAIYIKQADKVFVTLAKGSENTLSDTADAKRSDDVDAVVFSKDDLTINGEGKLTVTAKTGHAVVSKDDLVISGGNYILTSQKKALDANDSIRIGGGSFTIDSGTDALHAESDEASKGFIYIADGSFTVTAGTDGLDASGAIQIDNGMFTLKTGGGSANASTTKDGGFNGGWGRWGGRGKNPQPGGERNSGAGTTASSSSAKGIKSDSSVAVNNGALTIDSSDDAIHSDKDVTVSGGAISIASGDDGIHAGAALTINGGSIAVSKSYEGLEGMTIDIGGGSVSVVASDDGLNAAGGSDRSSMNGRPGQNQFAAQENVYIRISGGTLHINSSGDGIDSNGDVTVSGGEVTVSGASDNGNAALDFNGEATVTGGTFIAAGMSGMAQNFGSGSTQGAMMVVVDTQQGGSEILLKDSSGKTLASFTPEKAYNTIVISTPDVKAGSTYTVIAGSASTTVKMDSLLYGSGGGRGGRGSRGRR